MRRGAWWIGWWVVLALLWVAFVGEWNATTWGSGAVAGAAAATIAEIVRAQRELRFRLRVAWARELLGVPRAVVQDCVLVLSTLRRGRAHEGIFHARRSGPRGSGATAAGHAAVLTYVATFSPNAYVVDLERTTGDALLHDLVSRRASEAPV